MNSAVKEAAAVASISGGDQSDDNNGSKEWRGVIDEPGPIPIWFAFMKFEVCVCLKCLFVCFMLCVCEDLSW
jgi:hypothetical protein